MKKQNKWLDNFGKADNANESNVSLPEDFNGLAYDTTGRNYSPAWGGQFQTGGTLPGSPGFTYARTGSTPSNGKYAKKTMPSAQVGETIPQDETRIDTQIADKIAGLELKQDPNYQYWKFRQSLPQLTQAPSRAEELMSQGLRYADVATDLMQLGNFIPDPTAQFIGRVGNIAGTAIDAYQALSDINRGDYLSAGINAGSALLPRFLEANSFRRNSKYLKPGQTLYPLSPQGRLPSNPNVINLTTSRVNYIEPFEKVRGMTDKSFMANRALLGTLGSETVYDALPNNEIVIDREMKHKPVTSPAQSKKSSSDLHQGTLQKVADYLNSQSKQNTDEVYGRKSYYPVDEFQNGGEMKFYQEGLDWKPKSMQDGGIVEDDMGYWNADNHGKAVRINSNLITMQGVYEPLLGISNEGDMKLMEPGKDYKFKGDKVTEYPIAQDGVKTPYEPVNSIAADIFRGVVPAPKNFSQMLAKEVLKDARMSNSSLNDNEKLILWNTIQNARQRTGKDSGGTAYQDYGNQGWGTPEEFHEKINRGKNSALSLISNSLFNPAFELATTIGRGMYQVDPDNPDVIHYTDNYDWNANEKNFSGENEYQKLRNYVRDNEDTDIDRKMFDMKFTLTKDEIDNIKKKKDWVNTGPQFGRYAGMPVFNNKKKNGGSVDINDLDAQPKKKLNQLLNFTNNPDKNWLKKYE